MSQPSTEDRQVQLLNEVLSDARPYTSKGKVAGYIPALRKIPSNKLAIASAVCAGPEAFAGDAQDKFSIQSISKVFTLAFAMQLGLSDELWKRVGREPSGDPFNSISLLEREEGIPRNPFINPGALVVADLLCEKLERPVDNLLGLLSEIVGENITADPAVAASEEATGYKNKAIANYIYSFGNIKSDINTVLNVYFKQCSIAMNVKQLARATRFLANDGVDPRLKKRVISAEDARRINALMLIAGTYDAAGAFAFEIGIPCKSGVGGGILGIIPDAASVCVWSPGLDPTGNSLAGRAALASFIARSGLSVF